MITLLYLSSATHRFSETDLVELLRKARHNNQRANVTGMLLYHDGNFLQALEGEKTDVYPLFDKITSDPRHQNVVKLFDRPLPERVFGEWSMAFRTLSDTPVEAMDGYSDFLNKPFKDQVNARPSAAYQFLLAFRETLR